VAEKKWLVMALHEAAAPGPKGSAVPGRAGSPREPLGRVVVDLADFAAEDGRATRALAVAFGSPATKAAVGPAKMTLTIGRAPRTRRPGALPPAWGRCACAGTLGIGSDRVLRPASSRAPGPRSMCMFMGRQVVQGRAWGERRRAADMRNSRAVARRQQVPGQAGGSERGRPGRLQRVHQRDRLAHRRGLRRRWRAPSPRPFPTSRPLAATGRPASCGLCAHARTHMQGAGRACKASAPSCGHVARP
jgi:hypothetical protein